MTLLFFALLPSWKPDATLMPLLISTGAAKPFHLGLLTLADAIIAYIVVSCFLQLAALIDWLHCSVTYFVA